MWGDRSGVLASSQDCKRHKPEGCSGPRLYCPYCLIMPCLMILQKISNHLELLKSARCSPICHAYWASFSCTSPAWLASLYLTPSICFTDALHATV